MTRCILFLITALLLLTSAAFGQTIKEAETAIANKQYESAKEIVERILDADKNNAAVRTLLGRVYHAMDKFSQAERELKRAVSADKTYIPAYIARAALELDRPRTNPELKAKAAEKFIQEALEISPGDPGILDALFRIQRTRQNDGQMDKVSAEMLETNPDDIRSYVARIDYLCFHELNVLERCRGIAELAGRALDTDNLTPEIRRDLGWWFLICGDPQRSYEQYAAAFTGLPEVGFEDLLTAGVAAFESYQYREADNLFQRGLAAAPADVRAELTGTPSVPDFVQRHVSDRDSVSFASVISSSDMPGSGDLFLRKLHHLSVTWMRHAGSVDRGEPLDYTGRNIFPDPYLPHWGLLNHVSFGFFNLLGPEEQGEFQLLRTESERDEYRDRWFRENDPSPATPKNEVEEEFYTRLTEVYEYCKVTEDIRIGTDRHTRDFLGYDDRGRVYLKYGPPDDAVIVNPDALDIKNNHSWIYNNIDANLYFDFVEMKKGYLTYVESLEEASYSASMQRVLPQYMNNRRVDLGYHYVMLDNFIRSEMSRLSSSRFGSQSFDIMLTSSLLAEYIIPSQIKKEELIDDFPTNIREVFKPKGTMAISIDHATFKGEGDKTRIEVYTGIDYSALKFDSTPSSNLTSSIAYNMVVKDEEFLVIGIDTAEDQLTVPKNDFDMRQYTVRQFGFQTDPGGRIVNIDALNLQSDKQARYELPLTVRDYSGDSLMLSDIQLASDVQEEPETQQFMKRGLSVAPYPFRSVNRKTPVWIYCEVYNLGQRPTGTTSYEVEYHIDVVELNYGYMDVIRSFFPGGGKEGSTSFRSTRSGNSIDVPEYIQLDLGNLAPGEVRLTVTVRDRVSGGETSRAIVFTLF